MKNKKIIISSVESVVKNPKYNSKPTCKKLKKLYNEYKNEEYHDAVTDELYIEKMEQLLRKIYSKDDRFVLISSILILFMVVLFSGYYISNFLTIKEKQSNNIISMSDGYLRINYTNLKDFTVTREKNELGISIENTSTHRAIYTVYAVTDEVTDINYNVLADNALYGTNTLNSKRTLLYSGSVRGKQKSNITLELWQNENYNINSQIRFYVDAREVK